MSLFAEPITCRLTLEERRTFKSVTVKDEPGGPQDLYHDLERKLGAGEANTITLEDDELLKVYRYAYRYRDGGYQRAFRTVIAAAWREGWAQGTRVDAFAEQPQHAGRSWDGGNS